MSRPSGRAQEEDRVRCPCPAGGPGRMVGVASQGRSVTLTLPNSAWWSEALPPHRASRSDSTLDAHANRSERGIVCCYPAGCQRVIGFLRAVSDGSVTTYVAELLVAP